jgi:hypothetical protein
MAVVGDIAKHGVFNIKRNNSICFPIINKKLLSQPIVNNEYYTINIIYSLKYDFVSVRSHRGKISKISTEYTIIDNELYIPNDIVNFTEEYDSIFYRSSLFYDSFSTAMVDLINLKVYLQNYTIISWQSNWWCDKNITIKNILKY